VVTLENSPFFAAAGLLVTAFLFPACFFFAGDFSRVGPVRARPLTMPSTSSISGFGRTGRGVENPSVETLDRLATALEAAAAELLLAPKQGEKPPATFPKGRKEK